MTLEVTCPLVGMFHHPPAVAVLKVLPGSCSLILRLEPENPYDPNAVQVHVRVADIPKAGWSELEDTLPPMGFVLPELLGQESVMLGFVKRDYAADLAPRLALASTDVDVDFAAKLGFAVDGKPLIVVDLELLSLVRRSSGDEKGGVV